MRGGSFCYLYTKAAWELFDEYRDEVRNMATQLQKYGRGARASQETQEIADVIDSARHQIETLQGRLKDVWHAVEWHVSCDYSEDQVDEELYKFHQATRPVSRTWIVELHLDEFGLYTWTAEASVVHQGLRAKGRYLYSSEKTARIGITRTFQALGIPFLIADTVEKEVTP